MTASADPLLMEIAAAANKALHNKAVRLDGRFDREIARIIFFSLEFFFPLHIADTTFPAPEMSNAHAEIRMNPGKQPLADFAVEKCF